MPRLGERLKNSWNAFLGRDPTYYYNIGSGVSGIRPGIAQYYSYRGGERQMTSLAYNHIAVSCSMVDIRHVRVDENDRYVETINDELNYALTRSANIDQTGREVIREAVMRMLNEGTVAIVPTVVDKNPEKTDSYSVCELRTGRIVEWFPKHVLLEVYNDDTGFLENVLLEKRIVSILENPFYAIMNEPSSTGRRLSKVLNQLDQSNNKMISDKLDMIIQIPWQLKSPAKRLMAERNVKNIEDQLANSPYGIAYTDSTEKIIQLNRPLENNLWNQAKELTQQLYNELGFTEAILNGSASEEELTNYNNRIINPIMATLTEEMERKWLSMTAITQHQAIQYFQNPFTLLPVTKVAEIVDKLTRNEVMTSNEVRAELGMKPSDDPRADQLLNSNMNHNEDNPVGMNMEENVDETVIEEGGSDDNASVNILDQIRQVRDDNQRTKETSSASILEELRKVKDERESTKGNILDVLRANKKIT